MDKVIKLSPYVKQYIWGGTYFKPFVIGDYEKLSELWVLSTRGECSSIVSSGPNEGKRLDEVISKEDTGPVSNKFSYFPILIKLIDAKDNLSVQVHPSDEYALKNENSFGKSEMWHIISADEGAGLYVGFNKDYSKEEIEKHLKESTILETLNFFEVKPGETYLINPGTIHAIGKGVRLIEIQQNSDLTYRLYDFLRKDANGNYRELHIDKGLKVINYHKYELNKSKSEILADNQYFKVERKDIHGHLTLSANKESFISFTFISGKGKVDDIDFNQYDTFFLPYGKSCEINGEGTLIISSVNK